jgi:hypothetical protein
MAIKFDCGGCGKEVTAPDGAAGRKGKCPFCGHLNEIPAAGEDDDLIPLAPIDDEEERRHRDEVRALYEQEQSLLDETGGAPQIPLDQREGLTSEELHHFVVNYCLDMADGKLARAGRHAEELHRYGPLGLQAINDFMTGMAAEPAMDHIPRPVLQGFLKELRAQAM